MSQISLFLALSGISALVLIAAGYFKKVNFKQLLGLFLFGVMISVPFIMIEYMGDNIKYYYVILVFILIELLIMHAEHKVKYFHDLIHHNISKLRFLSFILIGLGFTYSELSFTIFHSTGDMNELMSILPFKAVYALLTQTVLASAASLINVGNLLSETIYETVLKLTGYYSRITVISVSHYLYVITKEGNFILLIMALLIITITAFFYLRRKLDAKNSLEEGLMRKTA